MKNMPPFAFQSFVIERPAFLPTTKVVVNLPVSSDSAHREPASDHEEWSAQGDVDDAGY